MDLTGELRGDCTVRAGIRIISGGRSTPHDMRGGDDVHERARLRNLGAYSESDGLLLQGRLGNPAAHRIQRCRLRDEARGGPVTGDRVIRFTTAAVVCAVAAFAAVVSYSHIYGLGRAHGQDGTAARLLPLSVDGLILAASLVLLHEARNDCDAPTLARFILWLVISATIGANIAYGAGYGLLGALISAWPAVAFIGTVEITMQQVRRARAPRAATIVAAVPELPGDVEQVVRAATWRRSRRGSP